jgi:hypothetical protein
LKKHINHFAILVYGSPKIMLLTVYLHKDFIDAEGITVASVRSLLSPGVQGIEFDATETDNFSGYSDAPLDQ